MAAKSKTPAKVKKGKKPTAKQIAKMDNVGLKKAPPAGEVSGKMSPPWGGTYVCFACSSVNIVGGTWTFFTCWNCGAFNNI